MDPHAFVAEVYRRMSLRHIADRRAPCWPEVSEDPRVSQAKHELRGLLPSDDRAPILDVGFGGGWFLAACVRLGYTNLTGADFGIANKAHVKAWSPHAITLAEIESDIGTFLADKPETFEFIHMSHVIEHIPKYSLLWVVDALYRALKPGGTLMLRTPNMEGPCANSSLYVTLAHEYGFSSNNLASLLDICGFDEIRFHKASTHHPNFKQRLGTLIRLPFLKESAIRHRLFGVNEHGHFDSELIATARRGKFPPFFNAKYR
ncbi:MAG: class I SAM-dependent methyltransferase [Candidatus Sulfotelmatobacter sp.]